MTSKSTQITPAAPILCVAGGCLGTVAAMIALLIGCCIESILITYFATALTAVVLVGRFWDPRRLITRSSFQFS